MNEDYTKDESVLNWSRIYQFMVHFVNQNGLEYGAEIGIAGGKNIRAMLEKTNIKKIWGVDPHALESWNTGEDPNIFGGLDALHENVSSSLKEFGDRVELIRKPSLEGVNDFEDDSLDFVFIDALHDYDNVLADIACWSPKVRSGGFVMGHDYSSDFPGVVRAVRESFANLDIKTHLDIWYVRKETS